MSSDKRAIVIGLVLLGLVAGGVYYAKKNPDFFKNFTASQTDAVRAKAEKFINEQMLPPGSDAKIKEMVEENGLYKIIVTVQGQDLTGYISKDAKNFFPEAYSMDAKPSESALPAENAKAVSQKDVPDVELFVMSYCPYGLQIEKGILPVVELLGSKINFSLKFVDYVMHGEEEIDENLRQYCIQQQDLSKLNNYLNCFAKGGDSGVCLVEGKINTTTLNGCVSAADARFEIKKKFADQALWNNPSYPPFDVNKEDIVKYGVSGSPALVINGAMVSAQRDPQSLLNAICSGFTSQPAECGQSLSTASPSAGFGDGTTNSNSSANCSN